MNDEYEAEPLPPAPDVEPAPAPPNTVSIVEVLAVLPSGKMGPKLSLEELGIYLKGQLDSAAEKQRNERHALREQLYRDGGVAHMQKVIDDVFVDEQLRQLRKKWVPHARFTNPLKRIVNAVSMVYSVPAKRSVAGDDNNTKYQAVLELLRFDEHMLQASRLLSLHRALLLGIRVRVLPNGHDREPVLDIATPATVRVLMHPNDNKLPIAWAIKCDYRSARKESDVDVPHWTLWTDHERMMLREDFSPIASTYEAHGLGVCPWVPVTLGPPQSGFWPGEEGADLEAAHMSIWMQGVLLLKESKSATKQTVLQGDGTNMARGQAADSEIPTELADGQTATVVDMSMDLSMFRDTAGHILDAAGLDYELAPAVINHQGVQSAEARELMLEPLREVRNHQQMPWYWFERSFVVVVATVLAVDDPKHGFDPAGFAMQFGETKTWLDPVKAFDLYVKQRQAGITNTAEFMASSHRGMTEPQAMTRILHNVDVESVRQAAVGKLAVQTGASQQPKEGDDDETPANENQRPDYRSIAQEVLRGAK